MPVVQLQPYAKTMVSVYETGNQDASLEFARELATLKNQEGNNDAFFVADVGVIRYLADRWQRNLPRVRPFYSVNCNTDSVLLNALAKNPNIGFHCITKQNIQKVFSTINDTSRILYSNPCWTRGTLNSASDHGVQCLSVDNERDLRRIYECHPQAQLVYYLTKQLFSLILNVCIAINEDDPTSEFGCEIGEAANLLQLSADLGLTCVGIGFNLGTGTLASRLFPTAIECAANLFRIGRTVGHHMRVLNIGGGFAAETYDFEKMSGRICQSLNIHFPTSEFNDLEVIATPGRFFATSVFSLVTNVIEKDNVDASAITQDEFDVGKQAFVYRTNEGYYGPFGCKNRNSQPKCRPLFSNNSDDHFCASILGPSEDELDVIQASCNFRQLFVGDWLMWNNMGAYSTQNRGSMGSEYPSDDLSVYYVADMNYCSDNNNLANSDTESLASLDSIDQDLSDQAGWLFDWMLAFEGRERNNSNSF